MRRLALVIAWILAVVSICAFSRAISIAAQGPSLVQAERNGRVDADLTELSRRLGLAEKKLDEVAPQLAVVVSDVSEMKWIARGGAGFIVVQVLMAAFGFSTRRRADAAAARPEGEAV